MKIWQAITSIPAAIGSIGATIADAFKAALTWAFGIDGAWLKERVNSLNVLLGLNFQI